MITIKIKNKKWLEKNCEVYVDCFGDKFIIPSCVLDEFKTRHKAVVFYIDCPMQTLMGKILEVELEDRDEAEITNSRYTAAGYWIPNWAIEWVKEEAGK